MKQLITGILPCLILLACAGKKNEPTIATETTAIEKTGITFKIDSADAPSAVLSSITDSAALSHVIEFIQAESKSANLSESALKQYETVTMALEKPSVYSWKELSVGETNVSVMNNIRNKLFEYKGAAYYPEESKEKVTPFVNEPLPLVYVQRSYLHNPAALGYDIYRLPGRFVERNEDGTFELVTILTTLKNVPPQTTLTNEVLYSNKINDGASFNGKALIAGLSVEKERMMELIIQDVAKTIVPSDSIINSAELKKKISSIPKDRKKNIYFIEGAVLTVVNYRKFNKSKFKAGVNTNWVTAEGQTFNSDESFKKERLVSLDLVKIDKILP